MQRTRRLLIIGGTVAVPSPPPAPERAVALGTANADRRATTATARPLAAAPTAPATRRSRSRSGGTANAVERDSENGATWEVEVTRPDGKTVDVRLDENYKLVVVESDSERGDGDERE